MSSRPKILTALACLAAAVLLPACDGSAPQTARETHDVPARPTNWPSFVDKFIEDYFVHNPTFAVGSGRHDFDGQLPDWSAEGIAGTVTWLEQARAEAVGFPASALSTEQRFQRDYVISRIDTDLFWLRDETLEDSANLPAPDVLAAEIVEDLRAALEQFAAIAEELG